MNKILFSFLISALLTQLFFCLATQAQPMNYDYIDLSFILSFHPEMSNFDPTTGRFKAINQPESEVAAEIQAELEKAVREFKIFSNQMERQKIEIITDYNARIQVLTGEIQSVQELSSPATEIISRRGGDSPGSRGGIDAVIQRRYQESAATQQLKDAAELQVQLEKDIAAIDTKILNRLNTINEIETRYLDLYYLTKVQSEKFIDNIIEDILKIYTGYNPQQTNTMNTIMVWPASTVDNFSSRTVGIGEKSLPNKSLLEMILDPQAQSDYSYQDNSVHFNRLNLWYQLCNQSQSGLQASRSLRLKSQTDLTADLLKEIYRQNNLSPEAASRIIAYYQSITE